MTHHLDNTAKLAKAFWTTDSLRLSAQDFQSRFDELYRSSNGPATLWRLGGAANDYLRANPGSIRIPHELIDALLNVPIADGRIIGLKLANRCSSPELISSSICRALQSNHQGELYGGLYELGRYLEKASSLSGFDTAAILRCLSPLLHSDDSYIRIRATMLIEELGESVPMSRP